MSKRKMKDSGVEWLGEIPVEWNVGRVKNDFCATKEIAGAKADSYQRLALTLSGVVMRSKEDAGGLQPEEFEGYQVLRKNELVFKLIDLQNVKTSRVGRSPFEIGIVSPAYIVLRHRHGADTRYAEYFFLSMWMHEVFNMMGDDAVRSCLNRTDLLNIPFLMPSENEQRKIAAYLDGRCAKIDEMISGAKKTIEEYKAWKTSVIFEAVTGKNLGAKMKDSGIAWVRTIPEHWKVVPAKALFAQRKDRAFSGDRQLTASQRHGIIFQEDFMRLENQKVVLVEKDFDILKHVEPGDFVISMRSFQGGLEYSNLRGCISSAYVMLKPNSQVCPAYYKWLFKSDKYINALQSTSNLIREGQALRYANFVQIPCFVIPQNEQKNIAEYLDKKCAAIDRVISEKESLIADLESYKKSLIFECVTGKMEVA